MEVNQSSNKTDVAILTWAGLTGLEWLTQCKHLGNMGTGGVREVNLTYNFIPFGTLGAKKNRKYVVYIQMCLKLDLTIVLRKYQQPSA